MIYEYTEEVKREREVKPCPCCGSEDLYFWNEDRDESMHWSSALVKCRNCGHMVRIDGNDVKDPVGSGRYCQPSLVPCPPQSKTAPTLPSAIAQRPSFSSSSFSFSACSA